MRTRLAVFISIVQAILFVTHWFVYATFAHFHGRWAASWQMKLAFALLSISFVLASLRGWYSFHPLVRLFYTIAAVWLGVASFFFVASIACWILYPIGKIAGWNSALVADAAFALALAAAVYGMLNAARLRVVPLSVTLPGLPPQWRGRTAALVSDLHLGHVRNYRFVRRVVDRIAALRPDIVLVAGDLYDGVAGDFEKLAHPWRELASTPLAPSEIASPALASTALASTPLASTPLASELPSQELPSPAPIAQDLPSSAFASSTLVSSALRSAAPQSASSPRLDERVSPAQLQSASSPRLDEQVSPAQPQSASSPRLDEQVSPAQPQSASSQIQSERTRRAAPLGVYYIAGNHEEFYANAEYLPALLRSGIRVLNNAKVEVDGLQIAGVHYRDAVNPARYSAILRGLRLDRTRASLLLLHAPVQLPLSEDAGISLQLSGHTHGGQFFPWTWAVQRVWGKFIHGLQSFGKMQVYTTYGAGTWGPPLRVGTKPEIVLITFK